MYSCSEVFITVGFVTFYKYKDKLELCLIIFLSTGKVVDRVNGVKIAELTQKVRKYGQMTKIFTPAKKEESKEELESRLKRLINSHEVYMANTTSLYFL